MIELILWDFGGVFTASPFHAGRRFAESRGVDFDTLFATVFGPYHVDTDHPWHRVERGELGLAEAFALIAGEIDALGLDFALDDFFASLAHDPIDRTVVAAKVGDLRRRGLRNGIITNNAKEFEASWRKLVPVDELFDDVVDSSAVGMRKPNPAIYELALARFALSEPTRAVFLDDFAPNVDAARALGLQGIVVGEDPAAALAALDELLDH